MMCEAWRIVNSVFVELLKTLVLSLNEPFISPLSAVMCVENYNRYIINITLYMRGWTDWLIRYMVARVEIIFVNDSPLYHLFLMF
jgi:hypothetical protein